MREIKPSGVFALKMETDLKRGETGFGLIFNESAVSNILGAILQSVATGNAVLLVQSIGQEENQILINVLTHLEKLLSEGGVPTEIVYTRIGETTQFQITTRPREQTASDWQALSPEEVALVQKLTVSVCTLEISVRTYKHLKKTGIETIGELVQKTQSEMLKTKNFGRKSLNEIKEILRTMDLSLGMELNPRVKAAISPPQTPAPPAPAS